jgi:hypothetical protein
MQITQTGVDLNMTADGFTYDGKVIDDPVNPIQKGQATFIECETTPANTGTSEIGRTEIIVVKPDGIGATFTAQSILSGGGTVFQTCRWNYKRVDTGDPGVPECSAVSLSRTAPTAGHRSR